jgi:hypothetical protein
MITRATRAVSPLEPILASRYEPLGAIDAPAPAAELSEQPATRTIAERIPLAADRDAEVTRTENPIARAEPGRVIELERIAPHAENSPVPRPVAVEIDSLVLAPARPAPTKDEPRLTPRVLDPLRKIEVHTQRIEVSSIERTETEIRSELIRSELASVTPPRVDDRPNRANMRAEAVESRRTEPVEVHVTIGHIEVRAAAPAKAPVRRPAPPRVSLDDYLKRRNGGAR